MASWDKDFDRGIPAAEDDWGTPLAALTFALTIVEAHVRKVDDEETIRAIIRDYASIFKARFNVDGTIDDALATACLELCRQRNTRGRGTQAEKADPNLLVLDFQDTPRVTVGSTRVSTIERQDSRFALLVRLAAQVKSNKNNGFCHDENDLYMTTGRQELYALANDLANLGSGPHPIVPGVKGTKQHRLNMDSDQIELNKSILGFRSRTCEKLVEAAVRLGVDADLSEEESRELNENPLSRFWAKQLLVHLVTVCRQHVLVSMAAKSALDYSQPVMPPDERKYLRSRIRPLVERTTHDVAEARAIVPSYVIAFLKTL